MYLYFVFGFLFNIFVIGFFLHKNSIYFKNIIFLNLITSNILCIIILLSFITKEFFILDNIYIYAMVSWILNFFLLNFEKNK